MPAISTCRVARSMKNRTKKRFRPLHVQTSTLKKSAATIRPQCCARNSFQLVFRLRSGAGSMPCRRKISAIVLTASLYPHMRKRALNTSVSPSAIFPSQADYLALHFFSDLRSTRSALDGAIVFLGNQFAVPVQQSVRHHQGVQLGERFATQNSGLHCQATSLIVAKPQSQLACLLAQHSVLFLQIFDHLLLALVHPSSHPH